MGKYFSYRHPQTTNERRQWEECEELLDEYPSMQGCRASRNHKNLPDSWDDIGRSNEHCWKSQRKTQYKVKQEPKVKQPRPKVTYDSERLVIGRWRRWMPLYEAGDSMLVKDIAKCYVWYRVKLGYRKHKMPK